MTTAAENEILTRVGPGTPMGGLMRQFWIPAAMSSELKADGDPVRLLLLGEKLIAFRDTAGRVGIMDHRCPHRCASLFFGRNEEGGIRCVYHGWKFDAEGNCLEMANVPPHQDFRQKVGAKAYRTAERNGLVWVYMGAEQESPPPLPPLEANLVPEEALEFNFQLRQCNWLQAVEGELDTSHLGFLHFGAVGEQAFDNDTNRFTVTNRAPEYVTRSTDYGFMYGAFRAADEERLYWRVAQFLYPCWTMPPLNPLEVNIAARAYVPMDDENTMMVVMLKKDARPAGRSERRERLSGAPDFLYLPNTTDWLGRWRLRANRDNDYLIDRELQRSTNFTGIRGIILQDQAVCESMGAITDRTFEHLAPSDVAVAQLRRVLLRAARAYADDGLLPPSAADTGLVAEARGGAFFAPEDADWLDAYRRIMAETALRPEALAPAE